MNVIIAAVIGLIAGLHTSTWGMYKDAPHEGFTWPKYFRSTVIGGALAVVMIQLVALDLTRPGAMVVFFGLVYGIERLLLELWKSFVRVEDQSKYFIPMRFGVKGKPVENEVIRRGVGIAVVAVLLLSTWGVVALQRAYPDLPPWLVLITIGSIGGWYTAFGGAWKDAPVEGFETLKFFRSPAISLFWAILVAFFTDSWVLIAIAGAGYSVATIETYKTFFFPNKPRGKFAGKPVLFPEMLSRRYYFVPIYVAIWLVIVGTYAVAFMRPDQGGLLPGPAAERGAAEAGRLG